MNDSIAQVKFSAVLVISPGRERKKKRLMAAAISTGQTTSGRPPGRQIDDVCHIGARGKMGERERGRKEESKGFLRPRIIQQLQQQNRKREKEANVVMEFFLYITHTHTVGYITRLYDTARENQ